MALIFANRYFHPDDSATARVLTELASHLSTDWDLRVITSRQLLTDANAGLVAQEQMGNVKINRVWSTAFGRRSLWGRATDSLSFHGSVLFFLLRNIHRGDVVVFKTDPPLLALVNTAMVRLKGGQVVNWLQDIYPEIAERLGKLPAAPWLSRLLAWWRDRTLRAAAANVVISPRMSRYLAGRGVGNTHVIHNWADENAITPVAHEANPLRAQWGLSNAFTVMYSGNFGRVHAFDEIIEAARLLTNEPGIPFVFIGEGAALDAVRQALECSGAGNISFKPYQSRESLRYSLGAADLHLVSLKAGMEDLVMPSKLYGILAAGRPVAFVGEPGSEIAAFVQREQLGFAVALGDGAGLAQRIRQLAHDPARQKLHQAKARAQFETNFTLTQGVTRWRNLLDGL